MEKERLEKILEKLQDVENEQQFPDAILINRKFLAEYIPTENKYENINGKTLFGLPVYLDDNICSYAFLYKDEYGRLQAKLKNKEL